MGGGEADFEDEAIFADGDGVGDGVAAEGGGEVFALDGFGFGADGDGGGAGGGFEFVGDGGEPAFPDFAGDLEDDDVGVLVGDEAGEGVGFGEDEAAGVGIGKGAVGAEDAAAQVDGASDEGTEEGFVEGLEGVAGEEADGHVGVRVPEAACDPDAVGVENVGGIAGGAGAVDFLDGAGEDPGGAAEDGFFAAGLEADADGDIGESLFNLLCVCHTPRIVGLWIE